MFLIQVRFGLSLNVTTIFFLLLSNGVLLLDTLLLICGGIFLFSFSPSVLTNLVLFSFLGISISFGD